MSWIIYKCHLLIATFGCICSRKSTALSSRKNMFISSRKSVLKKRVNANKHFWGPSACRGAKNFWRRGGLYIYNGPICSALCVGSLYRGALHIGSLYFGSLYRGCGSDSENWSSGCAFSRPTFRYNRFPPSALDKFLNRRCVQGPHIGALYIGSAIYM